MTDTPGAVERAREIVAAEYERRRCPALAAACRAGADDTDFAMTVVLAALSQDKERTGGGEHELARENMIENDDIDIVMALETDRKATLPTEAPGDEVREVLGVFARLANGYDGIPPAKYFGDTDCELRYPGDKLITVTLDQCRQARAALRQSTPSADAVGEARRLVEQARELVRKERLKHPDKGVSAVRAQLDLVHQGLRDEARNLAALSPSSVEG